MKSLLKKVSNVALPMVFLFLLVTTGASAAGNWPDRNKHPQPGGGYSVAEPTAVLLLGAGLVSLGIYAKKKRGKK